MEKLIFPDEQLENEGFTANGLPRFKSAVDDFAIRLFTKSITYADADKEKDMVREVTHEHVRMAVTSVLSNGVNKKRSGWSVFGQIMEYVMTAGAGVGLTVASTKNLTLGIVVFALCSIIALVLINMRLIKSE